MTQVMHGLGVAIGESLSLSISPDISQLIPPDNFHIFGKYYNMHAIFPLFLLKFIEKAFSNPMKSVTILKHHSAAMQIRKDEVKIDLSG